MLLTMTDLMKEHEIRERIEDLTARERAGHAGCLRWTGK